MRTSRLSCRGVAPKLANGLHLNWKSCPRGQFGPLAPGGDICPRGHDFQFRCNPLASLGATHRQLNLKVRMAELQIENAIQK